MADFSLQNHGTLITLTPTSSAGKAWITKQIAADATRWGACSIVIEPRYVEDIVDGITADGLSL